MKKGVKNKTICKQTIQNIMPTFYNIFLFVYNIMGSTTKAGIKWSMKYKKSINCNRPKGFSQKQYCKYGRTKKRRMRNKNFK
uniref:Uncharacterized protein n=1 Tax=viral metagenome TaxID=1070528 RepID=A0A6C0EVU9_9ZZZZ